MYTHYNLRFPFLTQQEVDSLYKEWISKVEISDPDSLEYLKSVDFNDPDESDKIDNTINSLDELTRWCHQDPFYYYDRILIKASTSPDDYYTRFISIIGPSVDYISSDLIQVYLRSGIDEVYDRIRNKAFRSFYIYATEEDIDRSVVVDIADELNNYPSINEYFIGSLSIDSIREIVSTLDKILFPRGDQFYNSKNITHRFEYTDSSGRICELFSVNNTDVYIPANDSIRPALVKVEGKKESIGYLNCMSMMFTNALEFLSITLRQENVQRLSKRSKQVNED